MGRWESLPTLAQAAVAFPLFGILLFLVNLGVFAQPVWRSILYGIIEGAPLAILLLVATNNERRKRDPKN
jgi:hypothetical protein